MIKFRTVSGSMYEVDMDRQRVRRINRDRDASTYTFQRAAGQWVDYAMADGLPPREGATVWFYLRGMQYVRTSQVEEILYD